MRQRFSEQPEALGISRDELKQAMQRLFDAEVIKVARARARGAR
jgi:hypothetical protein